MMKKALEPDKKYIVYVVLGIYPCTTGGMEIFYSKLLPVISKRENVILVTNCKQINPEGYKIYTIPERILFLPGTQKLAALFFTFWKLIRLRKKIKIVHLPYTGNAGRWGFLFPVLKKQFGINYLIHIHGGGMKPWKKRGKDMILFKNASKLLAVSDVIKKEYEKRTGRNILVVLPLVPFATISESNQEVRKKYKFNPEDTIILYVGSLKEIKSPDVLLEAFLLINEEFINEYNLKLVFVGDGILKEDLQNRAISSRYRDNVYFTGKITYEEIPYYYKMSDVYIIPSRFEGTPKSLLEAMFNKIPVIGADVNGINNVLSNGKDALLFEAGNFFELKKKIIDMLTFKERTSTMRLEGWKTFNQLFSFNKTINTLVNLYDDLNI